MNLRVLFLLLLLAVAGSGCSAVIRGSEVGTADPLSEPMVEEATAVPDIEVPTAAPAPTVAVADAFCAEVGRPALFLFVPNQAHELFDPATGARCQLAQIQSETLMPHFGGGDLFYVLRGAERTGVYRVQPGGEPQLLPAASLVREEGAYTELNYIVSEDGSTIAWSVFGPGAADATTSDILVAPVSTAEETPVTALVTRSVPEPRVLQPVRFSADKSVLYYTLAPMGIGGSWIAFTGRYDNLYAVPTAGGEPALIFDCQAVGLGLCLGDFQVVENEVTYLAYADDRAEEKAVVLLNGEGQELNRLTPGGDYVGYPTISPGGELVFYSAALSEESLLPEAATLYRVAPPTAAAEVLASDPRLVLPQRFLDEGTVVAGYAQDEMAWGLALVTTTGEMRALEGYENAVLLEVVR